MAVYIKDILRLIKNSKLYFRWQRSMYLALGEKFFIVYVCGGMFSLTFNTQSKIKLSKAHVMSIIWTTNLYFETK